MLILTCLAKLFPFSPLHSLTVFINGIQTVIALSQMLRMDLRTQKNIFPLFQRKLHSCIEMTRIIVDVEDRFKEIGQKHPTGPLQVAPRVSRGCQGHDSYRVSHFRLSSLLNYINSNNIFICFSAK